MVSTWIQPLNQLISTRFATHLFSGSGASAMDYANTLYTMIAGILVLSITNVIFPEMSRLSTGGRERELGELISGSLRSMLFLLLPMMAGLILLSEPLVRLLYEWKSWDSFSTTITARALVFMSLGMVGYGVQNVLSRAFYAEQDGKTPLISGVISIIINLILCFVLTDLMDVAGLGLATAISSTAAAVVLLIPAIRKYPAVLGRTFWKEILKMVLATVLMAVVVYGTYHILIKYFTDGLMDRIFVLAVPVLTGAVIYFVSALVLRIPEMDVLRQRFQRK